MHPAQDKPSADVADRAEHFSLMREALDHIARTTRRSRTSTRRLRWIENRAEDALAGKPYVQENFDAPHLDSQARQHKRIQRLSYKVAILSEAINKIAAMKYTDAGTSFKAIELAQQAVIDVAAGEPKTPDDDEEVPHD